MRRGAFELLAKKKGENSNHVERTGIAVFKLLSEGNNG
jgi:hypothetical protein